MSQFIFGNHNPSADTRHYSQPAEFSLPNQGDSMLGQQLPSTPQGGFFSGITSQSIPSPTPTTQSDLFGSIDSPPATSSPLGFETRTPSSMVQPSRTPTSGGVNPKYIEGIVKRMALKSDQVKDLHFLLKVSEKAPSLSTSDTASRIYLLACQFKVQNRIETLVRGSGGSSSLAAASAGVLNELQIRLEDTFKLTNDQRKNIRRVAQDVIYQGERTAFKDFHHDVQAKLTGSLDQYQLMNVKGNPAREAELAKQVRTICSQVRNGFRQDIRDSVIGPKKTSLTTFTIQSAAKYRSGMLTDAIRSKLVVHNALLRRFAYENQDYLSMGEPEDDSAQPTAQKRTSTGHAKSTGRVADGLDFWSRVDQWFAAEIAKRNGNRDLTGDLWRPYSEASIHWDDALFDSPMPSTSSTPSAFGVQPTATEAQNTTATAPSRASDSGDEDILDMM